MEGFTAAQACELTSCTPHQLRYWDKVGLVEPSIQTTDGRPGRRRIYSFRDLVGLRVVKSLLDNGLSIQRVRRAWDYLRRTGDMDGHLAEVKLVTDGQSIFAVAHNDTELLDALRQGQLAFFVKIDEIALSVEDDVTKVPETARHEPLDDLIENADEDSNQGAGDENRLVLDAGSQGLEKQHAENPVLEEVDRLLGLSYEAPCPDDQDGGDPEQQCGIFDVETPSSTAEEDESGRTQRNHHEDHAYADELGWPSRHEVLSEAEDERDRGENHCDPCKDSEPTEEGTSGHQRHGTRGGLAARVSHRVS